MLPLRDLAARARDLWLSGPAGVGRVRDQLRPWHLVLLLALIGVVAHQAVFWNWFIEDAAISFAYARHLVEGEGLVAFRGGERVEGYSNPTWVALLTLPHLLGIDPFSFTKWIQLLLAVSTAWMVFQTVKDWPRPTGVSEQSTPGPALVAVAFLAGSSQFGLWGAAGLEGALMSWLIALALRRMGIEQERGGMPWSAVAWLLVALSRPEGILYAAVGGFFTMVSRRSIRATALWLLVFFAPWTLYQAWHWWYFAWPLPNTFYAKLGENAPWRWDWSARGWRWIRDFFHNLGLGYFLPVWLLGVLGHGRLRFALALGALLLAGTAIQLQDQQRVLLVVWLGCLWGGFVWALRFSRRADPGPSGTTLLAGGLLLTVALIGLTEGARAFGISPAQVPVPAWGRTVPPVLLAALAALLPALSGSRWLGGELPGRDLRLVCWGLCCSVVFFAIYVQWDWMKGFRWMSTAAVPGAILFGYGVDSFVRFIERAFSEGPQDRLLAERDPNGWSIGGTVLAGLLVVATLPANVVSSSSIARSPDATPQQIKMRVDYVHRVRQRLHIEERLVDLDVDQGAHLYWSDFDMMDLAGLIDVPFARHHAQKDFVREYLFQERRPHVAHVHGNWARQTKIPTHPEWRDQYVEIPPYPTGRRSWHPGTFIRRDLVMRAAPDASAGEAMATFDNGLELRSLSIPSEPGAGYKVYVEVALGWRKDAQKQRFRAVLFASDDERLASWELPAGYDWVTPDHWKEGEAFFGRFDLPLPKALPPGRYALGLVLFGPDGQVIPVRSPASAEEAPSLQQRPRLAQGEALLPIELTVLTPEERARAAVEDRKRAYALAEALDCEGAAQAWRLATYHRAGQGEWRREHGPGVQRAIATCWALSSDGLSLPERARALVRARETDYQAPAYQQRAPEVARALMAEGEEAKAAEDWETAYQRFSLAVDVDRSQAWARRYAEEARARRLGLK